jgi:hypothetical protein
VSSGAPLAAINRSRSIRRPRSASAGASASSSDSSASGSTAGARLSRMAERTALEQGGLKNPPQAAADSAMPRCSTSRRSPTWNATHIALRLQDEGARMIEFRQGFRSMAAPTRELEKLIVS